MDGITVSLSISADEYLKLYRGSARAVYARTLDGRSVRFPASVLQPFVTREGIRGTFIISFDQDNKFQSINRINNEKQ